MTKIFTQEKINAVHEKHKLWLNDEEGGERCVIHDADLSNLNLTDFNLSRAVFCNVQFNNAVCARTHFQYMETGPVYFNNAYLRHANFSNAQLPRSVFKGADLGNAILNECSLAYADFQNASLKDADLSASDLYKSNLTNSDLTNSSFCFSKHFNTVLGAKFYTFSYENGPLLIGVNKRISFGDLVQIPQASIEDWLGNYENWLFSEDYKPYVVEAYGKFLQMCKEAWDRG